MSLSEAFDAAVGVAHSTIEGLVALMTPIGGGAAAAIVLFTVAVRLLISPLTYLQIRGERRRAALAPDLAGLQRTHRDDPATLTSETLALYRANGVRPLAGLLPSLVQAPFFMIMYHVALTAPPGTLFGVPLSAHLFAGLPAFAVLLAIATALAWLSSRRIRQATAVSPATNPRAASTPKGPPKTRPILDLWLPSRHPTPDLPQPQLQDRGKETWRGRGVEQSPGRRRAKERRGGGTVESSNHGTELRRNGGALAVVMPWLPFGAIAAVAWLPLAGALYLTTSMAWTALERSLLFARRAVHS
jgi:YidC/Oxa1 family membrane protein insertase